MNNKIKKFDEWIKSEINTNIILSGISLAIFDNKELLYEYIYGVKDVNTKEKITKNDRFCIASCTKSFLCTTIWKLIESKQIPNIYELTLGEIFDKINEDYKKVKVKSLANNISGIPWNIINIFAEKELYTQIFGDLYDMDSTKSLKNLALRILSIKPPDVPETKFIYSSLGFCILAYILELYTNKSFIENIYENIFNELNMKSATFDIDIDNNYVNGHAITNLGLYPPGLKKNKYFDSINNDNFYNPMFMQPAGGIWCTVNDSVLYLQEYIKVIDGSSDFLKRTTVNEILSTSSLIRTHDNNYYNYGWVVNNDHIGHTGAWFNMDTRYYVHIKNKIGIVININCRTGFDRQIIDKFIEIFGNVNQSGADYYKYIKYKTKYLELLNGGGQIDNGIYYETKGKYNGCTIVLFPPPGGSAYDWDHERRIENGKYKTIAKFNFIEELGKLTQIFMYDSPGGANQAIDDYQRSTRYILINELDFESRVERVYYILKRNKIKAPYVLIGHSLGAFDALVFAKRYPTKTKAVILLDGTRHCNMMYEQTEKRFENVERINMTDKKMQKMINNVVNNPNNLSQIERFEIVLTINNYYAINSLLKYWDEVPDKLDHIRIVGLWNIWIAASKEYANVPIERRYDAQTEFLETMKEYHEILGRENKDNYDAYFFFDRSHSLHFSNTDDVIDIIKKYLT